MGKQEFDEFLRKEERKKTSFPNEDWKAEAILQFQKQVEKLYSDIMEWLKEYTDSNKIKLIKKPLKIEEEILGWYSIDGLDIAINENTAHLVPYGTNLIGTKGRIDLIGNYGVIRFILADKNAIGPKFNWAGYTFGQQKEENAGNSNNLKIDWTWKITTEPPNITYSELNQNTFLESLMEVINDKVD